MRRFVFAALLAATAATPALAQDAAPFTGLRVEGLIGVDRVQANDDHKDGLLYGVGVGYDVQAGSGILGVEAELSDATTRTCVGSATFADPRDCLRAGRDIYVGGRIGKTVGTSTLLYAKAGYTNGRAELSSDNGAATTIFDRENLDGVRVGAGAEYAVGPNSFIKAEYRYSNYEQGVTRHQVLGGFGFRF